MTPLEARELLDATVAAFSVLSGVMAYASGYLAAQALAQHQPAKTVAEKINEGIGMGFSWGSLPAGTYHFGVDLMERITSFPWGTLVSSAIVTVLIAIAIFAFGAPAWILLPATWGGLTLHTAMSSRVDRRHERWQ